MMRRAWILAVAVTAFLAGGWLAGTDAQRAPAAATPSLASSSAGSVAALRTGHWSGIPRAPIIPRQGATVVWSGRELVVWGGAAGYQGEDLRSDGAAYDPASGRWRMLAPAGIAGRSGQSGAWTGRELTVWGGYTHISPHSLRVTSNGAAYEPATNSWHPLPRAPLTARADAFAVWTGREVLILGGHPAVMTARLPSFADGAAYDPASNRWRRIAPPEAPGGHRLDWVAAVQTPGHLLAWSNWARSRRIGPNTYSLSGGTDLFDYDEHTGRWRLLPARRNEIPSVDTALWTGRQVLVRGLPYNCGDCPGPFAPEVTAMLDPVRDTWTRLSPDPLGSNDPLSTWTGRALVSFNGGGIFGRVLPGDLTVYDPARHRWTWLPRAPLPCDRLVWTGRELLGYCAGASLHRPRYDGIAFTPGTAGVSRAG